MCPTIRFAATYLSYNSTLSKLHTQSSAWSEKTFQAILAGALRALSSSRMAINLTGPVTTGERSAALACSLAAIVGFIGLEHWLGPAFPLGGLYLAPLAVAAAFLPRWPTFGLAIAAALLREIYGGTHWEPQSIGRLAVSLVAFSGGALFSGELVRNRRMAGVLLQKTEREMQLRANAESEARALVEGSPVGVLVVSPDGNIAMANTAACRLLGFEEGSPEGDPVGKYIPLIDRLLQSKQVASLSRTMMEASGRRRNGESLSPTRGCPPTAARRDPVLPSFCRISRSRFAIARKAVCASF